jgi:carbon storage regulator
MLVLTRRVDEAIQIGPDITITVVRIGPGSVRIGIEANRGVTILRAELVESSTQEEFQHEDRGVSVE